MNEGYSVKVKLTVHREKSFFGPGIVTLLELIDETGSVKLACRQMELSYTKAWTILKSCEEHLGFKLLHSTVGGKNGGGAALTENAEMMLTAYDEYCAQLKAYADNLMEEKFSFYQTLQSNEE